MNYLVSFHEHTHGEGFEFFSVLSEAFFDALRTLPFLIAVYLLIEFIEHRHPKKLSSALMKMGPFGAAGGAALGCVPQCGFSVAAANLYSGRLITLGTLIAVFISTSDEALPILLSHPEQAGVLWKLILSKAAIAIIAGVACDFVIRLTNKKSNISANSEHSELCENSSCGCGHHGIIYSSLHHAFSIFIFIFIVNLILNSAISLIGHESLEKILMTNSVFQPFLSSLIGFIPNCAASVVLTELYIEGGLSLGSLIGGLCTGAGVGLVVLFRTNKNLKQNLLIMLVMYFIAVFSGVICDLIF